MKRQSRGLLLVLLAMGVGGFAAWALWPTDNAPPPRSGENPLDAVKLQAAEGVLPLPSAPDPQPQSSAAQAPATVSASAPASAGASAPAEPPVTSDRQALEVYQRGMESLKGGNLLQARVELSAALLSGRLSGGEESSAVEELTKLAEAYTFGRGVMSDDPYAMYYRVKRGEVLQRIERDLKLRVPTQLILRINGISDAGKIYEGQSLKMILGPMHAVVSKSRFTMDVYLQRDQLPRVFVQRFKVGLGKDDSTPLGLWRVGLGRKMVRAPWNPPATAAERGKILWGDPAYPLGKEGYWIGLEGMDDNTRNREGYGIHGTNDPESIGKSASLGCIRLADDDIAAVFAMLYEYMSTVEVRQ